MKLQVGSAMPSLERADEWLNGEFDVDEHKGGIIIVQFWSVSCAFSKLNMPYVVKMLEHYRADRVALVSVHTPRKSSDKESLVVKQVMDEFSLDGPCAIDNSRAIGRRFEHDGIVPYYFLFDRSGSLRIRASGKLGLKMIDGAIKRLLDAESAVEYVGMPERPVELNGTTVKRRSSTELFFKAGKAMANWGADGFKLTAPDVLAARLDACRQCEHLVQAPDQLIYKLHRTVSRTESQICNQCGCVAGAKAKLPTERCPVADPSNAGYNRWGQAIVASPASDRAELREAAV